MIDTKTAFIRRLARLVAAWLVKEVPLPVVDVLLDAAARRVARGPDGPLSEFLDTLGIACDVERALKGTYNDRT
jgi:hypothetical protein